MKKFDHQIILKKFYRLHGYTFGDIRKSLQVLKRAYQIYSADYKSEDEICFNHMQHGLCHFFRNINMSNNIQQIIRNLLNSYESYYRWDANYFAPTIYHTYSGSFIDSLDDCIKPRAEWLVEIIQFLEWALRECEIIYFEQQKVEKSMNKKKLKK